MLRLPVPMRGGKHASRGGDAKPVCLSVNQDMVRVHLDRGRDEECDWAIFEICRDRHMDAVGYNRETRYSYSLPVVPKA